MPLPSRIPVKPTPGGISVTPIPPGGSPPQPPSPPDQGPPIIGGDPGNVPVPPRARIRYGLISVHGIGPDEVALVIALPDNRVSASVMSTAEAAVKIPSFLPLIAPDPTQVGGRKEATAEHEVPTFEQEVLASLSEIRHGQNVILDYVAAPSAAETPATLPKTFWDILRFAADSDWPSVPGAPEKPANAAYEPLNGWRSVDERGVHDFQVLDPLTVNDAGNVNALCVRAWLGIGLLGRTGGDWADLLWRRAVVREVLAGNLPEIESLIPSGERDRVLWGILEGEVQISAGFDARVHDQIQGLFPVVPDGSGKKKSFAEIVAARIERLNGQIGGVPSGFAA